MNCRLHPAPIAMLFGYDPVRDLPADHLARLVELVVEEAVFTRPDSGGRGQPAFDPRLCLKVLVYGYATGVRSSRQLERLCRESLAYLFLTRGDAPSYRTLCTFRVKHSDLIEKVFVSLFGVADECGMKRLGRIVIDSTKIRADAGPEAVVKQREYTRLLEELKRILKEAQAADDRDEAEPPSQTLLGQPIETDRMREIVRRVRKQRAAARNAGDDCSETDQMRDIVRRVRRQRAAARNTGDNSASDCAEETKPAATIGPLMVPRVMEAIKTLEKAQKDGDKSVCLTDPDARMMKEGREKRLRECHLLEMGVDAQSDLAVAGQSSQSPVDNPRLTALVEAAKLHEPGGVLAVDADSGYYGGDALADLMQQGIDTCIPDSKTACDLHRGRPIGTAREKTGGKILLTYDAEADCYRCPEGNVLLPTQRRKHCGQEVTVYRAKRTCEGCPLASQCLTQAKAKRRTVKRGDHADILEQARQRFSEPEHRERYRHRAEVIESVFGFIRSVLGYRRWTLRGKDRVECEAQLMKTAYQLRKVHTRWAPQVG